MKKLWPVVLLLLAVAVVFIVLRSPEKPVESKSRAVESPVPAVAHPAVATAPTNVAPVARTAVVTPTFVRPALLDADALKAARAAIEKGDMDGVDRAYDFFLEYIKAHPENVAEFVAALGSEQNEHVLRAFTRALADSESGALENASIISAVIQLAQDRSVEQRQHIMLHLMSQFPQMNEEAHQALLDLSRNDPNSQVKTSAVAALADWMEKFPEKTALLLDQVGDVFKNAKDDDVRQFAYQVLALHKESLTRDLQLALGERLRTEKDFSNCNLIASALSVAPDDIRLNAVNYVQGLFTKENDVEKRRNLLAQIVALARQDSLPLLTKYSTGDSLLAQDARDYLALFSSNQPFDSQDIFQQKALRDAQNLPKESENVAHP